MSAPQTSSRLQQLQARFQQKQLQEKEQKLLQLYDQQQQRAHQVAQRGSAGSNDSNGSNHGNGINNTTSKVRQMYEERRQSSVKGIDKSYPLEPLDSKSKKLSGTVASRSNSMTSRPGQLMGNRRTIEIKRSTKADVNSNVHKSFMHRESFSTETFAGSRSIYSNSMNSSRGDSLRKPKNEYAKNGHHQYEINIDDVIDNEAMQRNRMLAKFQPNDIEKRRRFSGDFETDELPAGILQDVTDRASEKPGNVMSNARKSFQPDSKAERFKNTNTRKKPPTIPTGANTRKSTLMKTTKSASLKMTKPAPNRQRFAMRRKSSLLPKPRKTQRREKKKKRDTCCGQVDILPDWDTLKSTSLVCQIIRNHSKLQKTCIHKIGKVRTIVMKIENRMIAVGSGGNRSVGTIEKKHLSEQKDEIVSVAATLQEQLVDEKNRTGAEHQKEIFDSGKVLLDENTKLSETHLSEGKSISNKTISTGEKEERTNDRKANNRVRRASFEFKRMMFEQIQSQGRILRHDSVESALRHFDSIGSESALHGNSLEERNVCKTASDRPPLRLCTKPSGNEEKIVKGFERHTNAWVVRISRIQSHQQPKISFKAKKISVTPVSDKIILSLKETVPHVKKCVNAKLLEARDSIELARVPMKSNLPACKRKIISNSHVHATIGRLLKSIATSYRANEDERPVVETQSFEANNRVDETKDISTGDPSVNENISPSTKNSNNDASVRYDSSMNTSETVVRKNETPLEEKNRPVTKSISLKFLSRMAGSNGELASTGETEVPIITRKSSITAIGSPDTVTDSKNRSFDEEKPVGVSPAPRTSSSQSSYSSVGTHRSFGSTGSRAVGKTKAPTPAQRTTAPSNGTANTDDSLISCKICDRRFNSERIGLHEQICSKTAQKKRKQFDAVTHRVRGTELEQFVQKPTGKKQSKTVKPAEPSKSNWRRKHEDFINAIRSAKQMQMHLAAGGKLSDLPPPPVSDTSDYIKCPHCSRRFNQAAAERHIPKCETMQHNKPRAPPRQAKR